MAGLRDATPSVFHQRHFGRVLRSSCNSRGRRVASSRGREPRPSRCPPLWAGDLRNDGSSVPAAGAAGSEHRLDGTLRPDDRRGKEVRRFEHPGPDRLERGTRARGARSAVQQLKQESGKALAELGLIDEHEFVVQPRLAGHGPTLLAGLSKHIDLRLVSRQEFGSGAVAMRYEPRT
jgi:hypothetical protein